jgi:predicted aspartyl protease
MFPSTMPPRTSPERRVKAPSRRPIAMGVTTLVIEVANVARPKITERLTFTVDSGAVYSVVPAAVLRKLRIRPQKRETFQLANGATIVRQKGVALFKFREYVGGGDVIFGEKGDATLLGALSLESLGLTLDPIKRELRPMRLIL